MPIWLRKFTYSEMLSHYEEEKKASQPAAKKGTTSLVTPDGKVNKQAFKDAETNPITPRHRMPDGTQYTELQQKMLDSASFKTDEEDAHQTDDDDSIRLRRVNEVRARGRNNNKQDASTVRIPPVEEQSDPTLISRFIRSGRNFVSGRKDSSISKSDKPRLSATMGGSRNRRKVHRSLGEISDV